MHRTLGLRLVLAGLLVGAACSGDDTDQGSGDAGASQSSGGAAAAGGGGAKGTGSGKEGSECSAHADCASGLSCLIADSEDSSLKVCARPCDEDKQCKDGEVCLSETRAPKDAMCWKVAKEALQSCGPAFTSRCDPDANLGCLRVEDDNHSVAGGVCLAPCKLPKDGAKDPCSDGLTCLPILGDDTDGVCVKKVDRGEICDEPKGTFCGVDDYCLDDGDEWRCYQACSDSQKCDDGKTCKPLTGGPGSYCASSQ